MKKLISLSIASVVCILLLLSTVSCSSKHPITEFKEKMEKADSYQMEATMSNVPFFGTFTMTTKVDGNIQYTPAVMFDAEYYTETVGNDQYKYTKDNNGNWTKTKVESEDDSDAMFDDDIMNELFNPENYEKVDGEKNKYKQKSDVEIDEDFEDVVFTIDEDSCVIEMVTTSEGMSFNVKIVFSKLGEIELTLPKID